MSENGFMVDRELLYPLSHYLDCVLNILQEREDRPFLNYAAEKAEENRISVIEAPTGYGKSMLAQAFALRSLKEGLKCIVAFPLRTLLEDQLKKFRNMVEKLGYDGESVGARYMHYQESRYLIKPITLTTIDTLSLTLFGIAPEDLEAALHSYDGTLTRSLGHYLFSRAMVFLSDVVLDEVHLLSDATKSLNFLIALIRITASQGGRALFMSATIPKALEELLIRECGDVGLYITRFSEKPDRDFLDERRRKKYDVSVEKLNHDKFEKILGWVKEEVERGFRRAIVVFNTVNEAIEFYKKAKTDLDVPHDKMLLLHSRFAAEDREAKMKKIESLKKCSEYLIVSTQVIEAGVDISSNLFISDLAPASTLIQRVGRFLRYRGEEKGKLYLWYEKEEDGVDGKYKGVYDLNLLEKTLRFLNRKDVKLNFHDPESYQPLLDYVYDESAFHLDPKNIRKLLSIPYVLESPHEAVKMFIQLEGSFVRDDTIVPVIPSSITYEALSTKELMKHIVPINSSLLFRLKPKEMLVVKEEKSAKEPFGKIWDKEGLLTIVFKPYFLAFIVDGEYDGELGLVIKLEEGS
jgi:CRISPR-associated endonuclease/helicase Cas3